MMVVVAYDVETTHASGKKRLSKVRRTCAEWGGAVQDSVYECELDAEQYRALRERLEAAIIPETDSVRFYLLGNHYQKRIESVGRQRVQWDRETFVI